MTPVEKRVTWRRIAMEDTAWRFNRYAERAREVREENASAPAAEAGSEFDPDDEKNWAP